MASLDLWQDKVSFVPEIVRRARDWGDNSEYTVLKLILQEESGKRRDTVTFYFDNLGLGELKKLRDKLDSYITSTTTLLSADNLRAGTMSLKEWAEEVDRIWTSK